MARAQRRTKAPPLPAVTGLDATPERLAKDESDIVEALRLPDERMGKARKFRASHLDRLKANEKISYVQWYAGNWFRETHARCQFPLSVVASYGEHSGAGDHPGAFGYGLPRQEAQARARQQLRMARLSFGNDMTGFMERFLVHDTMPRYGGRAAMRTLADIRRSLDALAQHLRL